VVTGGGVRVIGPSNITSTVPNNASHLYARNVANFVRHLAAEGPPPTARGDPGDEILAATLVCRGGEIVHQRVLEALDAERTPA
jgi:NAD(P) transhydrogenase subunit alpha